MPTLYYVVSLVIGHDAASLMFFALGSEKSLTASAHTPSASLRLLHGMPTSTLCTAQATQLSHTRYWYDLEGVFHTLTLVYVDRSREVVSVSQSRSKPRTHKKNNPRPTLPTPSPPQSGPTFIRYIAISLNKLPQPHMWCTARPDMHNEAYLL